MGSLVIGVVLAAASPFSATTSPEPKKLVYSPLKRAQPVDGPEASS